MIRSSRSRQPNKLLLSLSLLLAVLMSFIILSVYFAKRSVPVLAGIRQNSSPALAEKRAAKFAARFSLSPGSVSAASVQLDALSYTVSEGDGFALINITRSGDTSGAASVDYATTDGTAGQRTKYELAAGTIKFAAGETTKSIQLLINDNTYLDGDQ